MKKNKVFGYTMIALSIVSLIILILGRSSFSRNIEIVLTLMFSSFFSIGLVTVKHNALMINDKDYSVEVEDERNKLIKEKTGNIANLINIALLGAITVVFIAYDYIIPAIITGVFIFLQPVMMIFISNYLEKKYNLVGLS